VEVASAVWSLVVVVVDVGVEHASEVGFVMGIAHTIARVRHTTG
jgi:hypothetical protein